MSALKSAEDFKNGEKLNAAKAGPLRVLCLTVGGGALLLFLIVALLAKGDFQKGMAYSWLFAVVYFISLAAGGIFWTLLHHASNSGWGIVVRRLMETLGSVIPVLFVLSLPIILIPGARDALWEWFPETARTEEAWKKEGAEVVKAHTEEVKAQIEAGRSALSARETESAAALSKAQPGEKAAIEAALAEAKAAQEKLEATDLSEEKVGEKQHHKHFKHESAILASKSSYLNPFAWYVRFALYFVGLTGVIYCLRSWSLKSDTDGASAGRLFRLMRKWSCGFLPIFAVSWTFLMFDWLMALDYTWFSTMWGVYLFAGAALNSMAFLILLLVGLQRSGHLTKVVTPEHFHIMGKLMHAFVIFWAYVAFSQFFLIWYANMTEETKFFLLRNSDGWNLYAKVFLVAGHFFVPFVFLLIRATKTSLTWIAVAAIWNLAMHFFDLYYVIIPERGPSITHGKDLMISYAWITDLLAFVAVGGIFCYFILRNLGQGSLFPCRDPRLDESLNLTN